MIESALFWMAIATAAPAALAQLFAIWITFIRWPAAWADRLCPPQTDPEENAYFYWATR